MAQFVEIYTGEDRAIVVNVERVESIEKIIEKNGNVYYSVMTNSTRYPMDEAGYRRFFDNLSVMAFMERDA